MENLPIKKGLVFGKFMPIHKGHIALIEFALSNCEAIIVSMSFKVNDPIDSQLRFTWLKDVLKPYQNIEIVQYLDDFDDDNLTLFDATKLWAAFIKEEFPTIDAFFCSEDYGEPLSFHLGLPCIYFDKNRLQIPVSAAKIRHTPFEQWDFIPDVVKPYFVKKICLFGPESVGKTTLTQRLAHYFNTNFAHEVVRDLISSNDEITTEKIIEIGQKQTDLVKKQAKKSFRLLFCDTDLITTQIYARQYLMSPPTLLFELEKEVSYHLYFLLNIDNEWIADPLRDFGEKRKEMFEIFKLALQERSIPYVLVSGNWEQKMGQMIDIIEEKFLTSPTFL